jgi:hypothetical protein
VGLYASPGEAREALSVLGAPRAGRCLGYLLEEEVGPSLPRGVEVVSTGASALRAASGDSRASRGYAVNLAVRGRGVRTEIRADVRDEAAGRLLVGLTTVGLGERFPPSLESSLLHRLHSRLASAPG